LTSTLKSSFGLLRSLLIPAWPSGPPGLTRLTRLPFGSHCRRSTVR